MTRACYVLTLLLVALGGSLLVTSPARCQISTDDDRCGSLLSRNLSLCGRIH